MNDVAKANDGGFFDEKEVLSVIEWLEKHKEETGATWAQIAARVGKAEGTLSNFRSSFPKGEYQGNVTTIVGAIIKYKSHEARRQQSAKKAVKIPDFVDMPTATRICESLFFAQDTPALTSIISPPGHGKTCAAQRYMAETPNVYLATMEAYSRTPVAMMTVLTTAIGVNERRPMALSQAIGRHLSGAGALIIIDEAQHLDIAALDQLRSFYDKHNIGIALMGNEGLSKTIDGKRDGNTAQIRSRLAMRLDLRKLEKGDACNLIAAWGVEDPEIVRFLKAIALKPGGLRNITMTMRQATVAQRGSGSETLTPDFVTGAWRALFDERGAA